MTELININGLFFIKRDLEKEAEEHEKQVKEAKNALLTSDPNPEYSEERYLSTEATCIKCKDKVFVRYSDKNYVCIKCKEIYKQKGCIICKAKIGTNINYNFPVGKERGYICKDCYKCEKCRCVLLDFTEETAKGLHYDNFSDNLRSSRGDNRRICEKCSEDRKDNRGFPIIELSESEKHNRSIQLGILNALARPRVF